MDKQVLSSVLVQKAFVPWLMDLISIVLGIRSSSVVIKDLRLTLDLKSVFINVDLPRPLWPVQRKK